MEVGHLEHQMIDGIVILTFIPVMQIICSDPE
jgi:hypothetical protein